MTKISKLISFLFGILFFFTPLILWPYTSEVFELNKIVFVYAVTALIGATWAVRCIYERKIIFRRTILDIPLLIFIASQILSTIFSIDSRTSFFGYYSRFNGGLLSILSYSLLYWAYVSNIDSKSAFKHLYILFASTVIAGGAAILEHFGIFLTCGVVGKITSNCWVQDVQLRVFSTFGQPNWLATWLVAIIPLAWSNSILKIKDQKLNIQFKNIKYWGGLILSGLFFVTLLFTGSRSGLLGFITASVIYWGICLWKNFKENLKPFLIFNILFLIFALIFGTQYSPSINNLIYPTTHISQPSPSQGPALETGGTESGTIRKIVWKGAVDVWKHYPIFGSGLETFAYAYYGFRPAEHNLVSEWDFIYNKAHNEFLNMAANSGTFGLLSYLTLIGFSIFIFIEKFNFPFANFQFPLKSKLKNSQIRNSGLIGDWKLETGNLNIALLAGYVSILVTNFFGFSVVPTQLLFFLFPAFAGVLALPSTEYTEIASLRGQSKKPNSLQIFAIFLLLSTTYFVLSTISKFWQADINYAKAKVYDSSGNYKDAIKYLTLALNLSPNEPLFHNEISQSYTLATIDSKTNKNPGDTQKYMNLAVSESQKAVSMSPANVNLRRSQFGVFIRLSALNPQFLSMARDTLVEAIKLAPTDAKLIYNLGLTNARLGDVDSALINMNKAVELKSNYKEARLAKALLLIDKKEFQKARDELNYIVGKLDPTDTTAKQTLEEIKNQ